MAVWSNALPLTASSLPTAQVQIPARASNEVASDLGLGGGIRQVLRFPPLLTTG